MENSLFNLKFTGKQLERQATKAAKEAETERKKALKFMKSGHNDIAAIHCQSAVRKQNEQKNLLRLSSQLSSVASRVQSAITMRQVTNNMSVMVRSMDSVMKSMNMTQLGTIMDRFEEQNLDLDVRTNYYEGVTDSVNAAVVPQDEVNVLMKQLADQVGVDLVGDLANVPETKVAVGMRSDAVNETENLDARLQRLRAE